MSRQVVSRTQRRMEKRQALVLLVLILGVSLVSFTLGVMVGRSGARNSEAAAVAPPTPRLPVAAKGEGTESPSAAPATERPAESLTFYDTLPKGEQPPLGSGINLPPKRETVKKEPAAPPEPIRTADATPAVQEVPRTEAPPQGAYLVQAASFRGADDATKLKNRLAGKAYAVFTEETDLKEKGIWHRVYVGPFATAEAANRVVEKLQAEEKIAALVKKR